MNKKIESVVVSESEAEIYSEEEGRFVLNAPSNFYVLIATGDRVYYKTKDRKLAQEACDEDWGKGKYVIRVVRDQNQKSKQDNGGLSVRGSNTRKCFSPRLKGLR